jgi:hypothetical protein
VTQPRLLRGLVGPAEGSEASNQFASGDADDGRLRDVSQR